MEENNKLIVISQLPIVEEQLEAAKALIDERTAAAVAGECSEDNYKEVKALRASLNKEKNELDSRYKAVMDEVTAPLKAVQNKYKECVSGYVKADAELKKRIETVETVIKKRKEDDVKSYFKELVKAKGIEWLTFDRAGIKVMMSSSKKSLRTSADEFVSRVECDIKLIYSQEDPDACMVEYKKTLNASKAIMAVKSRQEQIELEARRRQQERERVEQEQLRRFEMEQAAIAEAGTVAANASVIAENATTEAEPLSVPEIIKPKPAAEPEQAEKIIVLRLDLGRVRTTMTKAKKLKAYIDEFMEREGGYERL